MMNMINKILQLQCLFKCKIEIRIINVSCSSSVGHHLLTAGESTILLRRRVLGVDDGDDGVDFVNGGRSENRRVRFGEEAERNNVLTFNLSIVMTYLENKNE